MTDRGAQTSVFISYNRGDREQAVAVQELLESRHHPVWRDQTNVYGGERWPKTLGEAVSGNSVMVLIWSERAAQSNFVELEWCTALALRKPVIPILLDNTPLPASLAAMHGLQADQWREQLPGSIDCVTRQGRTSPYRRRQADVLSALQSGSEDADEVLSRMRDTARALSTPRYLALEMLRRLVLPGLLALSGSFAATAVVWDNPLQMDARLVMFGAMLIVPTALALTTALAARRRVLRSGFAVFAVAWLALLVWQQPRIVAGPVAAITEPSVVVLVHKTGESNARRAELLNALPSLPATLGDGENTVALKAFVYTTDPDTPYVRKAIQANPYVRAVVKVSFEAPDSMFVRMELPGQAHWHEFDFKRVITHSIQSDLGFWDQTLLVVKPDFGIAVTSEVSVSELDYRLRSANLGLGIVSDLGPTLAAESQLDPRSFTTTADEAAPKLEAAAILAYDAFLRASLGRGGSCALLDPAIEWADELGFEALNWRRIDCMDEAALASGYHAGSLPPYLAGAIRDAAALQALDGQDRAIAGIDFDQLRSLPAVSASREIFDRCGNTTIDVGSPADWSSAYASPDVRRRAACLLNQLQSEPSGYAEPVVARLVTRLVNAYVTGHIAEPHKLVSMLGYSRPAYCDQVRGQFTSLLGEQLSASFLLAPGLLQAAVGSVCFASETAPRMLHLYAYLDQVDWQRALRSGAEEAAADRFSPSAREILSDALDALLGDHPDTSFYKQQFNQFVTAYNESGVCASLDKLSPALGKLGVEDPSELLTMMCDGGDTWFADPLTTALRQLAALPLVRAPVLTAQMALLSEAQSNPPAGDADTPEDQASESLTQAFGWFESFLGQLQTFYPELEQLPMQLKNLDQRPAGERLRFLTGQLAHGNSKILNAYLVEAYLAVNDRASARATLQDLVRDSNTELRRDFYTAWLTQLDGQLACGRFGNNAITGTEIDDYENITRILQNGFLNLLPFEFYMALLAAAEPIEYYAESEAFRSYAGQVYQGIKEEQSARLRDHAPGALLRLTLASFLVQDPSGTPRRELEALLEDARANEPARLQALEKRLDWGSCPVRALGWDAFDSPPASAPVRVSRVELSGHQQGDPDTLKALMRLARPDEDGRHPLYSDATLSNDLLALERHYQDRGWVNFMVKDYSLVRGSDPNEVALTVELSEGERYLMGDLEIAGDTADVTGKWLPLFTLESGEPFSVGELRASVQHLESLLQLSGFPDAKVDVIPQINDDEKTVDVTFFTDSRSRLAFSVRDIRVTGALAEPAQAWLSLVSQGLGDEIDNRLVEESLERMRVRLAEMGLADAVAEVLIDKQPNGLNLEFAIRHSSP